MLILAGRRALVAIRSAISTANWVVVSVTNTTRILVLCCLYTTKKEEKLVLKNKNRYFSGLSEMRNFFPSSVERDKENVIHKGNSLVLLYKRNII